MVFGIETYYDDRTKYNLDNLNLFDHYVGFFNALRNKSYCKMTKVLNFNDFNTIKKLKIKKPICMNEKKSNSFD